MASYTIYWPAGVPDDPLKNSVKPTLVNGNQTAATGAGNDRSAPGDTGNSIKYSATFPMSDYQFNGIWYPWWISRPSAGGPAQGGYPWYMRDPIQRLPYTKKVYRWLLQSGQEVSLDRDGIDWLVTIPLLRLPS